MSLRRYCIYGSNPGIVPYSLLIDSPTIDESLYLTPRGILTISQKETVERKKYYTKIDDAYALLGILRLNNNEPFLIYVANIFSIGQLHSSDVYKITNAKLLSLIGPENNDLTYDSRLVEVQRLLCSGIFYFSVTNDKDLISWDITRSCQKEYDDNPIDNRFFWNKTLFYPLERFGIDSDKWLTKCTAGSAVIRTIYIAHETAKLAIISRLSCERVGTRFNVRGADHEGHAANFVETEQIITYGDYVTSFTQIRGSVPLIWEQPGINVGSHKVQMLQLPVSLPIFEKHFDVLIDNYKNIVIANLLASKDSKDGEGALANAYKKCLDNSKHRGIPYYHFDYHEKIRLNKESAHNDLLNYMKGYLISENIFVRELNDVKRKQFVVIRTNCLDCLDRTNRIQTILGLSMVENQINALPINETKRSSTIQRVLEVARDLWQKNGDQCSFIYAGTGALEGKSKIKDATRSVARTIQNNILDSSKQDAFDIFLYGSKFGDHTFDKALNLLPSDLLRECPHAVQSLLDHQSELIVEQQVSVFVGTWNVNGGKNMNNIAFKHENSMESWIFPELDKNYDVVAVGFEEIVDLNATNMVKTKSDNKQKWSDGVFKCLESESNEKYALIGSKQLVGVCLMVFIKTSKLHRVKDIAIDTIKTGMGGTTGNKGSVSIRFTFYTSSFCFVCSHFAAGQSQIKERNDDFLTTIRGLKFPQGRTVESHDFIFWLGDFNYRINLSGDEVKNLIRYGNLSELRANDQLTQQKENDRIFQGFIEKEITFLPTYKYDTFSDDYDTSEKARSPAWTDRILMKNNSGRLSTITFYGRAEIKTSDHRPVMAKFIVNAAKRSLEKCESVLQDVLLGNGPPDGIVLISVQGCSTFPEDQIVHIRKLLVQLGIRVVLHKIENEFLWLVLEDGIMALAALSMNNVVLQSGAKLNVKLRNPNWNAETYQQVVKILKSTAWGDSKIDLADKESLINFNVDSDEEEICSLMRTSMPTTPRPVPPPMPARPLNIPKVPPRPCLSKWPIKKE
uniref:phosphoinositide 5-phosphatase n=1 Tax=Parastrongyloides trichosuri TaxID=131310 RepID=A0A0N5A741_PARTI